MRLLFDFNRGKKLGLRVEKKKINEVETLGPEQAKDFGALVNLKTLLDGKQISV